MFTRDIVLAGTVVIEGVAFRWSVTDGYVQRLTVRHPTLGTRVEQLVSSPEAQARAAGRQILAGKVTIPDVDVADDVSAASIIDLAVERKRRGVISGGAIREQIEAFVGRKITGAEWLNARELLKFIELHPGAEAVFEQCIARGLSAEQTIQELSKLPPVDLTQ